MRRLFPALNHGAFARLWLASSISLIGSSLTLMALPLLAWDLTGSATAFASVFVAGGLGMVVAGTLGGVIADRFDRRRLLMLGDAVELVLVLALIPIVARHEWAPIPVVAFLIQVAGSTFSSAGPALRRDLLPESERQSGNALQQLSTQAANLVAPLAGAAAYQRFGMQPILLVDAATYVVSIALIAGLRHPLTRPQRSDASAGTRRPRAVARIAVADLREGAAAVRRAVVLRRMLLVTLILSIGNGAMFAGIMPWISIDLHAPKTTFGLFVTTLGLVGLVTALVLARLGDRIDARKLILYAMPPALIGAAVFQIRAVPALLAAAMLFGMVDVPLNVATNTVFQRRLPSEMQGRISSLFGLAFQLPRVVGLLAFGTVADTVGARVTLVAWAVCIYAAMAAQLLVVRALTHERAKPSAARSHAPHSTTVQTGMSADCPARVPTGV
jgi:MFS family permease